MKKLPLHLCVEYCLSRIPAEEYKLKWQVLHFPGAFISVILCLYINTGLYVCSMVSVL